MALKQSFHINPDEDFPNYIQEARLAISLQSNFLAAAVGERLHIFPFSDCRLKTRSPIDVGSPICAVFPLNLSIFSESPDQFTGDDLVHLDVIVLGLEHGTLLFLELDGTELLKLDLCVGTILTVTSQSMLGKSLVILSDSAIFVLNMEDIETALRKCVSHMESFKSFEEEEDKSTKVHIHYRKFIPPHGEQFSHLAIYETNLSHVLDHIVTKSIEVPGEDSEPSWHTLPTQMMWMIAGSKPFLTFNLPEEISVSSVKSMLYSEAKRVLWGTKSSKHNTIQIDLTAETRLPTGQCTPAATTPLHLIHGLADERRQISNSIVSVSPDQRWLAVADSLGRVLLIDVRRRRVVRMWKGYREAELAFVKATGQSAPDWVSSDPLRSQPHPRSTYCLFIHAPHRRILEVWRLTHGPRLATWDVVEPVRLIQSDCSGAQVNQPPNSGAFLIDSKGVIYTLSVSPDLCLAGTDSEATLGYHEHQLMQECYTWLRSWNLNGPASSSGELLDLFIKFRTASWFERTLSHVVHQLSQHPHALAELLKDCAQQLVPPGSKSVADEVERNRMYTFCVKLSSLVDLYVTFHGLNQKFSGQSSRYDNEPWTSQLERICDLLSWDPEDARCCLSVYEFCASVFKSHAILQLSRPLDLHSFIACFTPFATGVPSGWTDSACKFVQFRSDGSVLHLTKIGSLLFGPFLLGHQSFQELTERLTDTPLSPDLLLLALTSYVLYWEVCHNLSELIYRLHRLYAHLLGHFCHNPPGHVIELKATDREPADQLVALLSALLAVCLDTVHISSAYLIGLVLRSLVYLLWNTVEQGDSDLVKALWACSMTEANPTFDGELTNLLRTKNLSVAPSTDTSDPSVSMSALRDLVDKWHDTCSQLEGLFFLGVLLRLPATDDLPASSPGPFSQQGFPMSLGRLLKLGRACLTEMFASWFVHCRVEPHHVASFYHGVCTKPSSVEGDPKSEQERKDVNLSDCCTDLCLTSPQQIRRVLFPLVYNRLPFTLELDTVMASICWLYYTRWLNEPEELYNFKLSIEFLRSLSSAGSMIAQGLCTMMWNGRLRFWYGQCVARVQNSNRKFSSTVMHLEKLKYVSMLLVNFMSAYINAYDKADVVPIFSVEREWDPNVLIHESLEGEESSDWGPASLTQSTDSVSSRSLIAETAVNQTAPDRRSLISWEQAVIVVAALLVFGCPLKPSKRSLGTSADSTRSYMPEDFFSSKDSSVITNSFNTNWISATLNDFSDSPLSNRRKFFLSWLIEQAVSSYRLTLNAAIDTSTDRHQRPLKVHGPLEAYRLFSSAALTLGKHWGFPKDMIVSHHVLFLYEAGLDEQAEVYLPQVQDQAGLASRLLIVVGRRVALCCLGPSTDSAIQLRWRSCVPFQLEAWLHGLLPEHSEIVSATVAGTSTSEELLNRLVQLVDHVLQHLPREASQYAMAELLRDTVYAIADEQ